MLECGVCMNLVCEPITLGCGHTFCRLCAVTAVQRSQKKCPSCRAVSLSCADSQEQNVMIANITQVCYPLQLEQRLLETQEERRQLKQSFPIFYYNLPMFPGDKLTLHIFEPRYKIMVDRIMTTSRKFGYVPNYTNFQVANGDVLLKADVCHCDFLGDGRVLLQARILSRQKILNSHVELDTHGLQFCQVEDLNDDPVNEESMSSVNRLHSVLRMLAPNLLGRLEVGCSGLSPLHGFCRKLPPKARFQRSSVETGGKGKGGNWVTSDLKVPNPKN
ncbi:unnamed protein product [Choristocarpus tenellus]